MGAGADEQTGLTPGFYTVIATSTASPGNGCSGEIIFEIKDIKDVISIPVGGLTLTDVADCSPKTGQITVNTIKLNGADITDAATLATYTFELFDTGTNAFVAFANSGSAAIFPSTAATLSEGAYTVRCLMVPQVAFLIREMW